MHCRLASVLSVTHHEVCVHCRLASVLSVTHHEVCVHCRLASVLSVTHHEVCVHCRLASVLSVTHHEVCVHCRLASVLSVTHHEVFIHCGFGFLQVGSIHRAEWSPALRGQVLLLQPRTNLQQTHTHRLLSGEANSRRGEAESLEKCKQHSGLQTSAEQNLQDKLSQWKSMNST